MDGGQDGEVHSAVRFSYADQYIEPYTKAKCLFLDHESETLKEKLVRSHDNRNKPIPSHSAFSGTPEAKSHPQKIIFDTDLGTDIDDALALLTGLHLPETDVEILGITTVYGHTKLRTKICNLIVDIYKAKHPNCTIPVIEGESKPLGTQKKIWHTGTEGCSRDMVLLSPEAIYELNESTPLHNYNAARFMIQKVKEFPQQVTITLLGAATNLAIALSLDPTIAPMIQHVVFMAIGDFGVSGDFAIPNNPTRGQNGPHSTNKMDQHTFPNPYQARTNGHWVLDFPTQIYSHFPGHNTNCDLVAASRVISNPHLKISFINNAVSTKAWFTGKYANELLKASTDGTRGRNFEIWNSKSRGFGLLFEEWLEYRSGIFNTKVDGTCPHDPLALLESVYPGKYILYTNGWVLLHEYAGYVSFVVDPLGPHRIGASHLDLDGFLEFIGKTMLNR